MFGMNARRVEDEFAPVRRIVELYGIPSYTPDLWELEQKKANLVFIHDDMMQLQPNHSLVQNGLSGFYPFQYGYTTKKFSFVKKVLGLKSFPIALDLRDLAEELPMYIAQQHRIRGEVYALRADDIIALDNHRKNGVEFTRRRVNINIGYKKLYRSHWFNARGVQQWEHTLGKEEMTTVSCWMYVGREEYWRDQLLADCFNFNPIDIIEEDRLWLNKYFQYSRVR